jgi:hypothetical protein
VTGLNKEDLEHLQLTDDPSDMEVVASDEVRKWIAAHGGELYVWVSAHGWGYFRMWLVEASTKKPKERGLLFRHTRARGFDLLVQADRPLWPKRLELDLERHKKLRAYWNGVAWVA